MTNTSPKVTYQYRLLVGHRHSPDTIRTHATLKSDVLYFSFNLPLNQGYSFQKLYLIILNVKMKLFSFLFHPEYNKKLHIILQHVLIVSCFSIFGKNTFVSISCRRNLINPNTQQEVANRSPTLSEIPKQDAIISQHKPCLVIDKPAPHQLQKSVHKFARKHEHHNQV